MAAQHSGELVPPILRQEATHYVVSCVPDDCDWASGMFDVSVEYRGDGLWAVCLRGRCLDERLTWDYEPIPSERGADWVALHRFPSERALELARQIAPTVKVNGYTVMDALEHCPHNDIEVTA